MLNDFISVVMANYNHGHFLEERICSFNKQTKLPYEIIVVDDCSTDNSVFIIERLMKRFSNVKLIKNVKNIGPTASINKAITTAKSKYIISLSADDILNNDNFFSDAYKILRKNNYACYLSTPSFFDDNNENNIWPGPLTTLGKKSRFFTSNDYFKYQQNQYFHVWGHSSIIKRDILIKYGLYNERFTLYSDWFTNHLIALQNGFYYSTKSYSALRRSQLAYSSNISIKLKIHSLLEMNEYLCSKHPKILDKIRKCNIFSIFGFTVFFIKIYRPSSFKVLSFRYFLIASFKYMRRKLNTILINIFRKTFAIFKA